MDCFQGKTAIVTGGASGIGKALCEELGRRGTRVVVADINAEGAEKTAVAVSAAGGQARSSILDVVREEDVRSLVEDTASDYGQLDYMFNNAGIAVLGEVRHMNDEQWQRILDINLGGVLSGTLAAYDLMIRQGFGHIVNTASQAGLHVMPGTTSYAATKHAVVGLSTSLRAEGEGLGVKVTVVCPGPVESNIIDAATLLKARKDFFKQIPSFMKVDAAKAAKIILGGVDRNQSIIVFPFHARVLWWLHRINPNIPIFIGRQGIWAMRKFGREES